MAFTGRGLIIGKFFPPHMGHKFLIEFGANFPVLHLDVMVDSRPGDEIPGSLRGEWLRQELYGKYRNVPTLDGNPFLNVFVACEEMPDEPDQHPDFWNLWHDHIVKTTGYSHYNYVFASEAYGEPLAKLFNAMFIPCDIARETTFGVSGTECRADPLKNFLDIIPAARPYFVKQVCIFGSESVGKTTLAKDLASLLSTVWCQEYARPYLEFKGPEVTPSKIMAIMHGQRAMEKAALSQAYKLLIKDTDLFATIMWSKKFLGSQDYDNALETMALENRSHLYIVPQENIPFEEDILRYGGDHRQLSTQDAIDILEHYKLPYVVLEGSTRVERNSEACGILNRTFNHYF